MKKYILAANWKMNLVQRDALKLAREIHQNSNPLDSNIDVILCPPFVHISSLVNELQNSAIQIGAQNCNENPQGAYTGEISAEMLKSYDCDYVILGHSERREYYSESNELINKKIKIALSNKLKVILCVGESLEERQSDKTNIILNKQLTECLLGINKEHFGKIIIAYEPIWAIGTGVTQTINEITETHNVIRNYLIEIAGGKGITIPILYGGSLNEKNASEILKINEVSGGLIGGASLKSNSFLQIIIFFRR